MGKLGKEGQRLDHLRQTASPGPSDTAGRKCPDCAAQHGARPNGGAIHRPEHDDVGHARLPPADLDSNRTGTGLGVGRPQHRHS